MKIIVDPMWSFMEVLDAAWEAYSSGGQEQGTGACHFCKKREKGGKIE